MVTTIGENQSHLMTMNSPISSKFLELILYCATHYDKKVAEISFDFWYFFQTHLDKMKLNENYKNVFSQLLNILIKQCERNNDLDEDEFKDFRIHASDCFLSIYYILFGDFYKLCQNIFLQSLEKKNVKTIESVLFALSSVGELKRTENLKFLNSIFQNFPNLPNDLNLHTTAIEFLGSYSDYIITLDSKFNFWCINFTLGFIWKISNHQSEIAIETSKNFVEFCESIQPNTIEKQVGINLVKSCIENIHKLPVSVKSRIYQGLSFIAISFENDKDLEREFLQILLGDIGKNIQYSLNERTKQNITIIESEIFLLRNAIK